MQYSIQATSKGQGEYFRTRENVVKKPLTTT